MLRAKSAACSEVWQEMVAAVIAARNKRSAFTREGPRSGGPFFRQSVFPPQ